MSTNMFRPMLCAALASNNGEINFSPIKYPVYVSCKLDGVRAMVMPEGIVSRNLKPIPNKHIRDFFANRPELIGLDGELIVGLPTYNLCYRETASAVMSTYGSPGFTFCVFDRIPTEDERSTPFSARLESVKSVVGKVKGYGETVIVLSHQLAHNLDELLAFEQQALDAGYEGVIINSPNGIYKYGRSTLKEGYAVKLKRFAQSEAEVIGFIEQMENQNERTTDALGLSERSSHQGNMRPKDTLGALVVKSLTTGKIFNIGTGFDDATRASIWANRAAYIGQIVTFKYFEVGGYDVPRFPTFIGMRNTIDL